MGTCTVPTVPDPPAVSILETSWAGGYSWLSCLIDTTDHIFQPLFDFYHHNIFSQLPWFNCVCVWKVLPFSCFKFSANALYSDDTCNINNSEELSFIYLLWPPDITPQSSLLGVESLVYSVLPATEAVSYFWLTAFSAAFHFLLYLCSNWSDKDVHSIPWIYNVEWWVWLLSFPFSLYKL